MKKLVLTGLLIVILAAPFMLSGQTYVIKVKVQMANARMEPDPNSAVVKEIPNGTLLEAKAKLGDWYEIVVTDSLGNSVSAYIHSMVVDLVSGEQQPVQQPEPIRQPVSQPQRTPTDLTPQRVTYGTRNYGLGGFKFMGGLALGNITYSDVPSSAGGVDPGDYKKARMGIFGGIGYESGGRMGLELDILYMQKGVKFKGNYTDVASDIDVDFDATLKVDMLTVPVLFKLRFMPGSTPYIIAGGEVSYVLSSSVSYDATDNVGNQSQSGSEDVKESIKEIDYGIVLGAGFEMGGAMPLVFEARYHMGLANMINVDDPQVQSSDYIKSNVLAAMVGFKF